MFRCVSRFARMAVLLFVAATNFLLPEKAAAQFYTYGNVGAGVDWRQIKSEHFTLIYPSESDSLARRYLFLMERDRENIFAGYDVDPKPIQVVLRTYNTTLKGMTTWAPSRVEITTTPSAYDTYSQNWEERQVLHELRHIPQLGLYTTGAYGAVAKGIGESVVAIGMGFQPTSWMMESDAIIRETVLSEAGRGRSGTFMMPFRTAFLENVFRDYDYWRYGSYSYFKPSNGEFGYMVNSFMHLNTDNWNATNDQISMMVKYWWNWNQWTFAFKAASGGMTARRNYRAGRSVMTNLWKDDDLRRGVFTPYRTISADKSNYTEYTRTLPLPDGSTVAVENGMNNPGYIVRIDKNGVQTPVRPFATDISKLAPAAGGFYWSETVPDIRWSLREWSIIRYFDLSTREIKNITTRTRLFNPSVSPDGRQLAVTFYPVEGGSNLQILDSGTGEVKRVFAAPQQGQITESAWTAGGDIYALAIVEQGEGLYLLDTKSGIWKEMIAPQRTWMTALRAENEKLYFSCDLDGLSNIYSFDPLSGEVIQLTNTRFGAFHPYFSQQDGKLHYSEYTLQGHVAAVADPKDFLNRRADFSKPYRYMIAEELTAQASKHFIPVDSAATEELRAQIEAMPSSKYSEAGHIFRVHSWAPFYYNISRFMGDINIDEIEKMIAPGVVFLSQNTLGTATSFAGYAWNWGTKRHTGHFNLNYMGLWPAFEFNFDFNDRARTQFAYGQDSQIVLEETEAPSVDASLLVYVPMNLSSGGWKRTLKPEIQYEWHNDRVDLPVESAPRYRQALDYGLMFESILPKSKSDIYPKFGGGIILSGRTATGGENDNGTVLFAKGYTYYPGFTQAQGVKITAQFQRQYNAFASSPMNNLCAMPRGYRMRPSDTYFKATLDYAIPIPLHEANFAFFYYLMRLKVIPFVDYAVNSFNGSREKMYSFGSALLCDCHLFRIGWELSLGVRYARTGEGKNSFTVVTSVPLK